MNFLDYYRENLAHIRSLSAEFAAEFPKIAARLDLTARECKDPYVERLLEGTAFLAARVEKKLDEGQPRLLESLMASVAPGFITPVPSYCILALTPNVSDGRLSQGFKLEATTRFSCQIPKINTPCIFSTIGECTLFPLQVANVVYNTREMGDTGHKNEAAQAAFELTLQVTKDAMQNDAMTDYLDFYIAAPDSESSMIQCQLMADTIQVYIKKKGTYQEIDGVYADIPNFSTETDILLNCQTGVRTFQRFLSFPQSFKYIRIHGMRQVFQQRDSATIELVFALKRRENSLSQVINSETLKLWCVPAANIFKKRTDRNFFTGNYEQHIIPDRTAPKDYEIYRIFSVEAFNERNETLFNSYPCGQVTYDQRQANGENLAYFSAHRRTKLFNNSSTKRSGYPGTEVFISLSGKPYDEHWGDIQQFTAVTLCTNRDLPLLINPFDPITPPQGCPITKVAFMVPPSKPLPPASMSGDISNWSKIAHISFNLSSVLWNTQDSPMRIIQFMLKSYATDNRDLIARMAEGITELKGKDKIFRFVKRGCVYYEPGYAIDLTLSTANYVGTGYFLFAYVVFNILRAYTPLNSCMEMTLHTDKRREVMVWRI